MTIARGFAASATLAGLALGLAAPATAAYQLSGHYIETEGQQDNQQHTYDWYFTPCGDGCASATGVHGGQIGQAQLANGQWTLDINGITANCADDGTQVPNSIAYHYAWDPDSLAGTLQITNTAPSCGNPTGYQTTANMSLKQAP